MKTYTVKQLARLAGVSVRTLHHYDEIGLLKPAFIGENRYRYYCREELLRLQDILFHRELGVPLQEIARALDGGGRDRIDVLEEQRLLLLDRVRRSRQLIRTIDRTIAELKGNATMMDSELYKGFLPEKQAEYENWLVDNYGPAMRERIEASKASLESMGASGRSAAMEELASIEAGLAEALQRDLSPNDTSLDPLLERHRRWVGTMWGRECELTAYSGLAELYVAHPDFRSRYETILDGFTDWLAAAMKAHVARH